MDYDLTSMASMPEMDPKLVAVCAVVSLVALIIGIIALAKIFKKAGKPGWHAIIPILNLYDLFDLAWGKGIMFLLMLIPGVNFIIMIILYVKLARSFGKSAGFAVGLIFLGFIFMLILAFGSAQYVGPDGVPAVPEAAPPAAEE